MKSIIITTLSKSWCYYGPEQNINLSILKLYYWNYKVIINNTTLLSSKISKLRNQIIWKYLKGRWKQFRKLHNFKFNKQKLNYMYLNIIFRSFYCTTKRKKLVKSFWILINDIFNLICKNILHTYVHVNNFYKFYRLACITDWLIFCYWI